MSEPILNLKDVKYKYPKGNFSLTCDELSLFEGEAVSILGSNGSGKTTLSKILCGIYKPDSGEIFVKGELANKYSLGKMGKNVGYLFQEPSRQLFATNVWEEMTFIADIKGEDMQKTQDKAEELLTRFGIIKLKDRNIYRLSRGEKQRLAICTILMQNPALLILDEPTTGIDKEMRSVLYQTLDNLINDGIGIAIITHDHEVINRYGEKKITIESGVVCQ